VNFSLDACYLLPFSLATKLLVEALERGYNHKRYQVFFRDQVQRATHSLNTTVMEARQIKLTVENDRSSLGNFYTSTGRH
jgi:hypothetical protein